MRAKKFVQHSVQHSGGNKNILDESSSMWETLNFVMFIKQARIIEVIHTIHQKNLQDVTRYCPGTYIQRKTNIIRDKTSDYFIYHSNYTNIYKYMSYKLQMLIVLYCRNAWSFSPVFIFYLLYGVQGKLINIDRNLSP